MRFLETIVNAITAPLRQLYLWLVQCLPGMRSLGGLSLPWKWSLLSFSVLLITWVATLLNLWLRSDTPRIDWVRFGLLPIPLILIIPFLVYHFVRYWMMEEVSKYPDIDRVWAEAERQMDARNISLAKTPLFLVLGSQTAQENQKLLEIGGLDLPIQVPASGDAPISIHASDRAVWVFLQGCNCVSRLQVSANKASSSAIPLRGKPDLEVESGGTIDASAFLRDAPEDTGRWGTPEPQPDADEDDAPTGTLLLDESQDLQTYLAPTVSATRQLSSQDAADCEGRLSYVAQRLRKARDPICPINGMMTLLPFALIENSSKQLVIAIQKDLAVLRKNLEVRVPNTVVVKDMECDPGFLELIQRLGPQQALENRFGKGSELWVTPDAARLSALAQHATGAFEDWIYKLFQQENALQSRYNSRLFGLLCRIRGKFTESLQQVLAGGFGFNPQTEPQLARLQFLFGGCYFAATGARKSEQAFLKSVLGKILQQEGELEWLPSARAQDARYQSYASWMSLLGLAALVAMGAMIAYAILLKPGSLPT